MLSLKIQSAGKHGSAVKQCYSTSPAELLPAGEAVRLPKAVKEAEALLPDRPAGDGLLWRLSGPGSTFSLLDIAGLILMWSMAAFSATSIEYFNTIKKSTGMSTMTECCRGAGL